MNFKIDKNEFSKNLARKIGIGFVSSFIAAGLFGADTAHVLVLFLLYVVVSTIWHFIILIKKKFENKESFLRLLIIKGSVLIFLISFQRLQIFIGNNHFDVTIGKITAYKDKTGSYPKTLREANVSENPYISTFGPNYRYLLSHEKDKEPILCLVYMSPFGRNCYSFKAMKKRIVD